MARTATFPISNTKSLPRSYGRALAKPVVAILVAFVVSVALVSPVHAEEHEVQPGESLSVIARRHGVSSEELAAANGISDLHLVTVGQVLQIPGSEPAVHIVRPGETLDRIADRVGVRRADVVSLNNLGDPNQIRPGQRLLIPNDRSVPESADPAAGYHQLPGRLRTHPERLKLIPSFERWSQKYGVPTDLLMAVAYRESGWQSSVVSHKGAVGVGQLLPTTSTWVARDLLASPELDPRDPDDNIRMSARLLRWLIGHMGSEKRALAGYYQGPGSVRSRGLFDDTQEYITNITQLRSRFRQG